MQMARTPPNFSLCFRANSSIRPRNPAARFPPNVGTDQPRWPIPNDARGLRRSGSSCRPSWYGCDRGRPDVLHRWPFRPRAALSMQIGQLGGRPIGLGLLHGAGHKIKATGSRAQTRQGSGSLRSCFDDTRPVPAPTRAETREPTSSWVSPSVVESLFDERALLCALVRRMPTGRKQLTDCRPAIRSTETNPEEDGDRPAQGSSCQARPATRTGPTPAGPLRLALATHIAREMIDSEEYGKSIQGRPRPTSFVLDRRYGHDHRQRRPASRWGGVHRTRTGTRTRGPDRRLDRDGRSHGTVPAATQRLHRVTRPPHSVLTPLVGDRPHVI